MTYNILLFGESGAGKSTTINALANYLRYSTFEDAIAGEFTQKIPSKFTLYHPETYEELVMQHGDDDPNEQHNEEGQSITQSAKSYFLTLGDKQYRIIDTPGMGDTRGLEVDKKNFQSIMEHLKTPTIQQLHAICFLIKTNTSRKTATFSYCLNQLLTTLHRDACANIIFCFTFSRNSLYGPGDGFQTLKGFFKTNQSNSAPISLKTGVNCFYIDNEAFRFLLAKKHKYPFQEDQEKDYKESWDKSVAHAFKMLNVITTLPSHNLTETFTIIDARRWIIELKSKFQEIESDKENYEEFQTEYVQLEDFIFKLAEYVTIFSNVISEKLIEPYLDLLLRKINQLDDDDDAEQTKSPILKRRKFSNNLANKTLYSNSEQKLQIFNDFINAKNGSEIVTTNEIVKLAQKMTTLKHLGDYFVDKLEIERIAELQNEIDDTKLVDPNSTENLDPETEDSQSQIHNEFKLDKFSINSIKDEFEPPVINIGMFRENSSDTVFKSDNLDAIENGNDFMENSDEFLHFSENDQHMLDKTSIDSDQDYHSVDHQLSNHSDTYSEASYKSTADTFTNHYEKDNEPNNEATIVSLPKPSIPQPIPAPRKSTLLNQIVPKEFPNIQIDDAISHESVIIKTTDEPVFDDNNFESPVNSNLHLSVENHEIHDLKSYLTTTNTPPPLKNMNIYDFLPPVENNNEILKLENFVNDSESSITTTNSDNLKEEIDDLSTHSSETKIDTLESGFDDRDHRNVNNRQNDILSPKVDPIQNDNKSELENCPESEILPKSMVKTKPTTEQLYPKSESYEANEISTQNFSELSPQKWLTTNPNPSNGNLSFLKLFTSRLTANTSTEKNTPLPVNLHVISIAHEAISYDYNSPTGEIFKVSGKEIRNGSYISYEFKKQENQSASYQPCLPVNVVSGMQKDQRKQTNVIGTSSENVQTLNDYRKSSKKIVQSKQQETTVKISKHTKNHQFNAPNSVDEIQNIEDNFSPSNDNVESENEIENIGQDNPQGTPSSRELEIKNRHKMKKRKRCRRLQWLKCCWGNRKGATLPLETDTIDKKKKKFILCRRPKWLKKCWDNSKKRPPQEAETKDQTTKKIINRNVYRVECLNI